MTSKNGDSNSDDKTLDTLSSKEEIKSELSKVASNPKQNAIIMGAIALVALYLIYNIYQSSIPAEDKIVRPQIEMPKEVLRNNIGIDTDSSEIKVPTLPEPPKLTAPSAPPAPPPPATPPPPSWGYARGRDTLAPRPPRAPVARVAALALISIPRSSPLAFFSQTRHGGSPRLLIRLTRPGPSAAAASFSAGAKDRDLEHAGDALSDAAPSGLAY